jgi:hypothetical protein
MCWNGDKTVDDFNIQQFKIVLINMQANYSIQIIIKLTPMLFNHYD